MLISMFMAHASVSIVRVHSDMTSDLTANCSGTERKHGLPLFLLYCGTVLNEALHPSPLCYVGLFLNGSQQGILKHCPWTASSEPDGFRRIKEM